MTVILVLETEVYTSVTTDVLEVGIALQKMCQPLLEIVLPGGGLEIPCSCLLFGPREH